MDKWLRTRLSDCLAFDVPEDMIKYIQSIKSPTEFDDYFQSLLNQDNEDHRLFLNDCKQRLFSKALPTKKPNGQAKKSPTSGGAAPMRQNLSPGKGEPQSAPPQGAKKKTKLVNLYGNANTPILLKGRRFCDCQAAQHDLISNCLSCGRIVCAQEGSGPCLFCGELVYTKDEEEILRTTGKKSENLLKTLRAKGGGESLKKAYEQRDRLLEYDKNSEKRTTVIDDEFDYFEENSVWLSDAERVSMEQLKKDLHDLKHSGRATRKIKVDFAGRVIDDDDISNAREAEKTVLQRMAAQPSTTADGHKWSAGQTGQRTSLDTDPNMAAVRPKYRPSKEAKERSDAAPRFQDNLERTYNRVQDKQLLEMQDMRACLSMHQPWASLLVAGIKKDEGRVWYSDHRGRLWIAAGVHVPSPESIREAEQFYRAFYNDPNMKFPDYPTGCLLGCVKVEDCLAQEEYREVYPSGESESPFVFVCSNPEKLPVVFPLKGEHKIFQIDPKIHMAATKVLLRQGLAK